MKESRGYRFRVLGSYACEGDVLKKATVPYRTLPYLTGRRVWGADFGGESQAGWRTWQLVIARFERRQAEFIPAVVFEVALSPAEVGMGVTDQLDDNGEEIGAGPAVPFGQGLEGNEESFDFLAGIGWMSE